MAAFGRVPRLLFTQQRSVDGKMNVRREKQQVRELLLKVDSANLRLLTMVLYYIPVVWPRTSTALF